MKTNTTTKVLDKNVEALWKIIHPEAKASKPKRPFDGHDCWGPCCKGCPQWGCATKGCNGCEGPNQ